MREVRDQRIADTEEGKLSTTKIEVVAERYKRRGGEFNTAKKFVSREQTMATKISKELDRQTRASTRKKEPCQMKLQLIQNRDFDFGELEEYYYVALTRKDDPDDDIELLHLAFTRKDIERAQYRTQKKP